MWLVGDKEEGGVAGRGTGVVTCCCMWTAAAVGTSNMAKADTLASPQDKS